MRTPRLTPVFAFDRADVGRVVRPPSWHGWQRCRGRRGRCPSGWRRRRDGWRWGLLIVLALGCRQPAEPSNRAPQAVAPVQVIKPDIRRLTHTVVQPGAVEAYEQTALYAKVSGFIESFSADIGQEVKKGDVLAEIFGPELSDELERKTAQVELARQNVEHALRLVDVAQSSVQTGVAQLAEAQAGVRKCQAEVVRWESELTRLTQMVQEHVVDRQVLNETREQLDTAKSAHDAAQAAVAARQAEQSSAEAQLGNANVAVDVARSQVKVCEADARQTSTMVGYTKIKAPYDAVVTVRNANTGDYVQAASGDWSGAKGVPIFVIARTDLFRVFVDVPEAFARYVNTGTKAAVRAEASGGIEIQATVTRTAWSLDTRSRTLRAEIDLPAKDCDGLRPGMYASSRVFIEQPAAAALPQEALLAQGNDTFCYLVVDGRAVKTAVQCGLSDGGWVQVLRRKAGDAWTAFTGDETVVADALDDLTDGQTVTTVPAHVAASMPHAPPSGEAPSGEVASGEAATDNRPAVARTSSDPRPAAPSPTAGARDAQ